MRAERHVYAQCSTGHRPQLRSQERPDRRHRRRTSATSSGRPGLQGIEISHGWDPALGSANGGTIDWQINGHRIIGNWVGFRGDGSYDATFRSATNDPGTGDNGQAINVYDGSNDNLVEGNYIASFYDGIQFGSSNAQRNTARGNFIGVSPLGEAAPMSRWGIRVRLGTKLDIIEGNTIRNATLGGIGITQNNVYQVRLTRNIVTDTAGWAIDLYGVAGSGRQRLRRRGYGANTLLNTPIITSATTSLVSGTGLRRGEGGGIPGHPAGRPVRHAGPVSRPGHRGRQRHVEPAGLAPRRRTGHGLQIRNDRDTSELSRNVLVGGGAGNQPPTADFTTSCLALVCTFTDASDDADGTIASRAGASATAASPAPPTRSTPTRRPAPTR